MLGHDSVLSSVVHDARVLGDRIVHCQDNTDVLGGPPAMESLKIKSVDLPRAPCRGFFEVCPQVQ